MRKGLAIYGASEEAIGLVPILEDNPEVEVVGLFSPDRQDAEDQARRMRVGLAVTDDPAIFTHPLHAVIDAGVGAPFAEATLALTEDGQRVLEGRLDLIGLRGIDRWWGGVRQQGRNVRWRWDEEAGRLQSSGAP